MQKMTLDFEGEPIQVLAEKINGQLWFHYRGKTFCYEMEKRSSRKSSQKELNPENILAPMPGKILKLAFKKGASVQAGEVVVVMEAMKMEYNLEAKLTGTIEVLNCSVNDQVSKDQVLVKIKEES